VIKSLLLYFRLISIQIRSQLHYRFPFLLDLIATGFITLLGFLSLVFVFQRFGHIRGWTLAEVAFLYGLVDSAFGLMDMVFSGFDPQAFGRKVRFGQFDQMMLKPVNLTLQVFSSEFILRRLGRILEGTTIFIISIGLLDMTWTFGKLVYLPVVYFSTVAFFGGLFIIGATVTFWTIESIEVVNIFTYGGTEMMSYPMHIYQDFLRRFFTYIIPAIFINYYPALYFLDKPDPFNMPEYAYLLSPIVGFGILSIALAFWRVGIRHYQSTGT